MERRRDSGLIALPGRAVIRRLRVALLVAAALPVPGARAAPFPVSRAELEFKGLLPFAREVCERVRGDRDQFHRMALPFAPLNLVVSKGSPAEADRLRSFFLGVTGAMCKVESGGLSQAFHCGRPCRARRKADILGKLPAISALVETFARIPTARIISHWGVPGEYRTDNLFVFLGRAAEAKPSAIMGFVPSGIWRPLPGPTTYLQEKGIGDRVVQSILKQLRTLSLVAIARDEGSVRVVRTGIADNESGLLFLGPGAAPPTVGEVASDGRRYVSVSKAGGGLYFYETD